MSDRVRFAAAASARAHARVALAVFARFGSFGPALGVARHERGVAVRLRAPLAACDSASTAGNSSFSGCGPSHTVADDCGDHRAARGRGVWDRRQRDSFGRFAVLAPLAIAGAAGSDLVLGITGAAICSATGSAV